MTHNRRDAMKILSALGLSSVLSPVLAQHNHGQMQQMPAAAGSLETLPPRPTPWEKGTCAFCGMPLATPANRTPGFFEQTYSQISLKDGGAHHFESIACMVNYAYVHGLQDGQGTTFYVADREAHGLATVKLIPARQAVYLWGEKRGWVVMDAKIVAFKTPEAAMTLARSIPDLGRTRILDWTTVTDLAPLPEMNLISLLAQHAGLLK